MRSENLSISTIDREIEINRLKLQINQRFYEEYTVYRIRTDKELWAKMDDLTGFTASCGLKEDDETYLYILADNAEDTRRSIHAELESKGISFSTLNTSRKVPHKLLVNAVCRSKGFVSLAGRNYWIERTPFYDDEGRLKKILDIPEIRVSKNGIISVHTVRFVRYRDNFSKLPAYKAEKHALIRCKHPDPDTCFVRHGISGKKAKPLAYLDTTEAGYYTSRTAIVNRIKDLISKQFSGLVSVKFDTARDIMQFRGHRAAKYMELLDQNIRRHFSVLGISSDIPEFMEIYDIPSGSEACIKVIKEKEAYAEGEDEYEASLSVQHVTEPTYAKAQKSEKTMKHIARACLTELAIKQDIAGSIDSFSGYLHELNDSAAFFHVVKDCYSYMRKSGMFLQFGSFDIFDVPDWVPDAVLDAEEEYIICRKKTIIGIRETDISPLPSSDAEEVIFAERGAVRNSELRNDIFGGILDAHVFESGGNTYYYSAFLGKGMHEKIPTADTFVQIVFHSSAKDDLEWLLPYVAVTYVNTGNRYTKFPYPFKYIREWDKVFGKTE